MTTIYIGNLDHEANVKDLHADFDRYGRIVDLWIAKKPPGFAFVEYDNEEAASDAVKDMDNQMFMSKKIRVEVSRRGRCGNSDDRDKGKDREKNRDDDDGGGKSKAPLRTDYRVRISGLPPNTAWKDLKSMLKEVAEPTFVDVYRTGGEAIAEFNTASDADAVADNLNGAPYGTSDALTVRRDFSAGNTGNNANQRKRRNRSRSRDRDRDRDRRRRSHSRSRSRSRSRGRDKDRKRRSRSRSRGGGGSRRNSSRSHSRDRKHKSRDKDRSRSRSRGRDRRGSR